MRGFKDGMAGDVIDVAPGAMPMPPTPPPVRRSIIAVQVQRGDHIKIHPAREHLLERDVGNGVLDDDARAGFAFGNLHHGPPSISTAPNSLLASS